MDKLVEIIPVVSYERGLYRVQLLTYGLDGMTTVAGQSLALTRHAAMGLQAGLTRALFAEAVGPDVLELQRKAGH